MLKELLTRNHVVISNEVMDWRGAIAKSVEPLEIDGIVPVEYKDVIIKSLDELGPYIFIAPEIAMPHAQFFENTEVGIALLKLNNEVTYDPERSARLFFSFSGKDGTSHMELIQSLAIFLSEEKNVNAIISMDNEDDIYDYIQNYG